MAPSFLNNWRSHAWAIFFCGVSAIGGLCYGYNNNYYNGVLAMREFKNAYGNHRDDNGELPLESSFQAVTTSSIYIGDLIGAFIAASINEKLGRRATLWFASFCDLIGGICQVADTINEEAIIAVGRTLIGVGVGQFTVTSLLYIVEVAPPTIRGPALMMFQFLQSWSQLIASCISQGTANLTSSLAYIIPMGGLVVLPLLMFALLPFILESPVWYIYKSRDADAENSLRKIHRSEADYQSNNDMARFVQSKMQAD